MTKMLTEKFIFSLLFNYNMLEEFPLLLCPRGLELERRNGDVKGNGIAMGLLGLVKWRRRWEGRKEHAGEELRRGEGRLKGGIGEEREGNAKGFECKKERRG